MASIPVQSVVVEPLPILRVSGELYSAITEANGAAAGFSFADLLGAFLSTGAAQGIPDANGSSAVTSAQTFGVFTGHQGPHELHRSGHGMVVPVPTDSISMLSGSNLPMESLVDAAGLSRLGLGASGDVGARGQGRSPLLAFPDEVSLLSPGSSAGAFEPDGSDIVGLSITPTTVSQGQGPMPIVSARFTDSPQLDVARWAEDFGSRLVWMAKENRQYVELRLNPPELGLLNVRMALQQNDAHIAIGVHHSAVREAIEATLPRLRELLAETGVTLVNVDVSSSNGFSTDAHGGGTGDGGADRLYRVLSGVEGDDLDRKGETGLLATQRGSTGIVDRYV